MVANGRLRCGSGPGSQPTVRRTTARRGFDPLPPKFGAVTGVDADDQRATTRDDGRGERRDPVDDRWDAGVETNRLNAYGLQLAS